MAVYGLRFPGNQDAPAATEVAFRFANPQSNGLPIWGPSNAGVTYMWEIEFRNPSHIGYMTTFFWGNDDTFLWDAGTPNTYYGAHPYPPGGSTDPRHQWEISIEGGDPANTLAGGPRLVVPGKRWKQAFRVNGSTKECRFYIDLPNVGDNDIIAWTPAAGYGNTNPPNPVLQFGDAPWSVGNERLCGSIGPIKIVSTLLTEADTISELSDMSRFMTAAGAANNWWSKRSFKTVDDLTDDYGTGRSFAWATASKATRVLWSGNANAANMFYPVAH